MLGALKHCPDTRMGAPQAMDEDDNPYHGPEEAVNPNAIRNVRWRHLDAKGALAKARVAIQDYTCWRVTTRTQAPSPSGSALTPAMRQSLANVNMLLLLLSEAETRSHGRHHVLSRAAVKARMEAAANSHRLLAGPHCLKGMPLVQVPGKD